MNSKTTSRYYDVDNKRILYYTGAASSKFWDSHWNKYYGRDLERTVKSYSKNRYIQKLVKKYLSDSNGVIVEGGCGIGGYVYCLAEKGFNVIGVDYAKSTLLDVKSRFRCMKLLATDVREIAIADNSVDLYISLGVIEHFYNGYDEIISEAKRMLKGKGRLIVTFPQISYLRRVKLFWGMYSMLPEKEFLKTEEFYQYLLDPNDVKAKISGYGFRLIERKSNGGLKGFKDEVPILQPVLQKLYDYAGKSILLRGIRVVLNRVLEKSCGHSCQMVFQKEQNDSNNNF